MSNIHENRKTLINRYASAFIALGVLSDDEGDNITKHMTIAEQASDTVRHAEEIVKEAAERVGHDLDGTVESLTVAATRIPNAGNLAYTALGCHNANIGAAWVIFTAKVENIREVLNLEFEAIRADAQKLEQLRTVRTAERAIELGLSTEWLDLRELINDYREKMSFVADLRGDRLLPSAKKIDDRGWWWTWRRPDTSAANATEADKFFHNVLDRVVYLPADETEADAIARAAEQETE